MLEGGGQHVLQIKGGINMSGGRGVSTRLGGGVYQHALGGYMLGGGGYMLGGGGLHAWGDYMLGGGLHAWQGDCFSSTM